MVSQHNFHVNQTVYYTSPSWLSRKVIIDAIEGNLAYIFYYLEDGTEMTGWVLLTDLTPLVKTAALVGDVTTINEALALDEEYNAWLYHQHTTNIRAGLTVEGDVPQPAPSYGLARHNDGRVERIRYVWDNQNGVQVVSNGNVETWDAGEYELVEVF